MAARAQTGQAFVTQDALDAVASGDDPAITVDDGIYIAVVADQVSDLAADLLLHTQDRLGVEIDDFAVMVVVLPATVGNETVEHIPTDATLLLANFGMRRQRHRNLADEAELDTGRGTGHEHLHEAMTAMEVVLAGMWLMT